MEEQYLIDKSTLEFLLKSSKKLQALESGGVDNWEWCGECISEFEELNGDIDNVEEDLKNFKIY